MTYTTLLVHLELGHPYAGLLQCARETATRFAAHVIGIAASQPFSMVLGDGYVCGNAIESSVEEIAAEERQAEADFRAALATGARSLEWRSTAAGISIADFVARNARGADLILTGAIAHQAFDAQRHVNRGDLLMLAGRPVLLVPDHPHRCSVDNVLVAWKDTRQAQRAVFDALPLLERATRVSLIELTSKARLAEADARMQDVARWLKRHGIEAEPRAFVATGNDATQLDAIADQQDADVIVAGAYGHSRFREWVIGGMTRELLMPTQRCSFLSH